MKFSRSESKSTVATAIMLRVAMLVVVLLMWCPLRGQVPHTGLRLWFRADTLLQTNSSGAVSRWGNLVANGGEGFAGGSTMVYPDNINGIAAVRFPGDAYLEAPSVMPVGRDYTLVVVVVVDNVSATNNIVSGNNRAFWLGSDVYPRILHNGDFGRQAVSSVPIVRPSVLRLRYNASTGIARISVDNKEGVASAIPENTDSVIFLGSYARGNFLNGRIAEVLVYERELEGTDVTYLDTYLHARYGIPRVPDPPAPWVHYDSITKTNAILACGDSILVSGAVLRNGMRRLTVVSITDSMRRIENVIENPVPGAHFSFGIPVPAPPHLADVVVVADTVSDGVVHSDTITTLKNITCGEFIAITGQSNSIWGASDLPPSRFARTFGGNFSQLAADTAFHSSSSAGTGGGANVGAWGLWLQNAIAERMGTATLVINGGVGGTRIEQHLPDRENRLNLNTIYGSWLYRIIKSGAQKHIRWLFWYQGESNGDTDDYESLFTSLYTAWQEDLPNLQKVVVIQIRPGCGPNGHTRIREAQRRFETRFPNVIVHAAAGLPGHDGCHYASQGYFTLGEQLFDIYRTNELSMMPQIYRTAPSIEDARCLNEECTTVRLRFMRGIGMHWSADTVIGGSMRTPVDAFFANNEPTLTPTTVSVNPDSGTITCNFTRSVSSISYVPDKYYVGTSEVYEGPWLVTSSGVGAISFHNIETSPLSVQDTNVNAAELPTGPVTVLDIRGRIVRANATDCENLPTGIYIVRGTTSTQRICVIR